MSTNDVTLTVPASMEVTFTPRGDGSMQVTLTPRAPAGRPPQVTPDALDAHRREQRAARIARRARPGGRGRHSPPGGQAWRDSRARNAAIRAFADADPRFSASDYETQAGNPYIKSALRRAWEAHEQARAAHEGLDH